MSGDRSQQTERDEFGLMPEGYGNDGRLDPPAQPPSEVTVLDPETVEAASQIPADPERMRRIITCGDFLPNGDKEWPKKTLASRPRGTRFILGNLSGTIDSTERKTTPYLNKTLESVWLYGSFEAIVRSTGEVITAAVAILPNAFGFAIERVFRESPDNDKPIIQFDCDIAVEATGRNIPFEWVVLYYREGQQQKAMREIKARRDARLARMNRIGSTQTKALPGS